LNNLCLNKTCRFNCTTEEINEDASCEKKFNDTTTVSRDLVRRPPRRLTGLNGSMSTLVKFTGSEVDEQVKEFDDPDDGKGLYRKRVAQFL
jgi:hypothetical protein